MEHGNWFIFNINIVIIFIYMDLDKLYYKNPFILITSCKNNSKRVELIKTMWLNYCNIPYKIIIGDDISEDYIIKDDYLIIKGYDSYNDLPYKIKNGINIINNVYKPDCILKCDDDVIINLSCLEKYLSIKRTDYEGFVLYNFQFCGGPLYFLSNHSINKIKYMDIIYKNEDFCVAHVLKEYGILPKNVDLYIDLYKIKGVTRKNKKGTLTYQFKDIQNTCVGKHYQNIIFNMKYNVYIKLNGGIGNRLFQIAFLLYLKKCKWIDCYYYNIEKVNHNVNYDWCTKILDKFNIIEKSKPNNCIRISEKHSNIYDVPKMFEQLLNININNNIILGLYFQSYKYFKPIQNEVIDVFSNYLFENINIKDNFNNSAFIHIRGGDYLDPGIHYIDLTNYYNKCIEIIGKDVYYYIVTNDLEYTKNILSKINVKNYEIITKPPFESLYYMTQCIKGCVTSNSTFSWWGSYLNVYKAPVYMPSSWYTDNVLYKDIYYDRVNVIDIN